MDPIDETLNAMIRHCTDFMGQSVGELLRDEVHFLRWKNAHRIMDRARRYLHKRQAQGKRTLPFKFAIRFLDEASLEDDPILQDLWARLLANAVDPNIQLDISKTHISLLSEMNGVDARLLQHIGSQGWLQIKEVAVKTGKDPLDCNTLSQQIGLPERDVGLALGNLWRIGCLIQEPTYKSGVGASVAPNSSFRLSPLGSSLLRAVELQE